MGRGSGPLDQAGQADQTDQTVFPASQLEHAFGAQLKIIIKTLAASLTVGQVNEPHIKWAHCLSWPFHIFQEHLATYLPNESTLFTANVFLCKK